eukprot:scaffold85165_cov35-Cyclotella_meneghiniana.AAC.1
MASARTEGGRLLSPFGQTRGLPGRAIRGRERRGTLRLRFTHNLQNPIGSQQTIQSKAAVALLCLISSSLNVSTMTDEESTAESNNVSRHTASAEDENHFENWRAKIINWTKSIEADHGNKNPLHFAKATDPSVSSLETRIAQLTASPEALVQGVGDDGKIIPNGFFNFTTLTNKQICGNFLGLVMLMHITYGHELLPQFKKKGHQLQ